jgi:hypothetical protein
MARYWIDRDPHGIAIELTEVAGRQEDLLDAFEQCQSGHCTCPTDEYKKMAGMDVASTDDEIVLRLAAKPGARFDVAEISACLDYTVSKIERA